MSEFKLIVAGGRDFDAYGPLCKEINDLAFGELKEKSVSIVSGMARGADALAVRFAREFQVKLHEFPADWNQYGKRAGFIRNAEMAEFSDALLAFHDGQSRGTAHMIRTMQDLRKPVWIVRYDEPGWEWNYSNQEALV